LRELAAREAQNDLPTAIEYAAEAIAVTDTLDAPAVRVELTRFLVRLLLTVGRHSEAITVIDRLIADLADDEPELQLELKGDLAAIIAIRPRYRLGFDGHLDRVRPEFSGSSAAERRILALLAYRKAQLVASSDEAADLAERALAGGQLLAEGVESIPLFTAGIVLGLAERSAAAEQLFGEIADRAWLVGSSLAYSAARVHRGMERLRRGALYEALSDVNNGLQVARRDGWHIAAAAGMAALLRILLARGDLERCERELEAAGADGDLRALESVDPVADFGASNRLLVERGHLRLAQQRPGEALEDVLKAGRREPSRSVMSEWRNRAAVGYLQLGERSRALEVARADLDIAAAWDAEGRLGNAASTYGWIEGGEEGIQRVRDALPLLKRSGARLDHARALVRLGAMLRRAGMPSEARTSLRSGLELARRCGALVIADTAEGELAATGLRRQRGTQLSGDERLTPSERRVADLAADGLANPEIGRALYISRKTVEMHLRNTFRKLGIDSRHSLGPTLGRR
jgi:DNA-binding CsgD family transcriptional regulator